MWQYKTTLFFLYLLFSTHFSSLAFSMQHSRSEVEEGNQLHKSTLPLNPRNPEETEESCREKGKKRVLIK